MTYNQRSMLHYTVKGTRLNKMTHTYKSPPNNKPFSDEGLRDLSQQCLDQSSIYDSALLEMAGLAIRRLLDEKSKTCKCARCKGSGSILGPSDSGYTDCYSCNGKGS